MSPPCSAFTAEQLPRFVQANAQGKKRKVEGGGNVDLLKCPLREFSQYRCRVDNPNDPNCPVRCKTVVRFFRECQDKKGTFHVETTAWEGLQLHHDTPPSSTGRT
ncbi:hypothetical protein F5X68DRAFT_53869 [Plectosphaerella plurivora]|uniref:Uncharacterized protein n=1 Tax=Plectosphaerella plurivora TaxID=936078 RepID=A0A9P9A435_9PEZI|nr:hypothetical protein F5X68DRAFT_53869 [Plectosphaerella plurivora]